MKIHNAIVRFMVQLYKYYDEDVLILTLQLGVRGQAQTIVTSLNTAKAMGSGHLEVFATPAMVALMEQDESFLVKAQNRQQRI